MRLAVRGLAVRQAPRLDDVVSFSAGVAARVPGKSAAEAQVLIELADMALYAAKAAGRNRVELSGTSTPVPRVEALEPQPVPSLT
jgi:PleD family two-component response regulator